jgi:hypothetical protein
LAQGKGSVPLKICVYAFSTTAYFFRALIEECARRGDDVEWSIIFPQGHFRHLLADIVPPERVCYLYEKFDAYYAVSDAAQIQRALDSGGGLVTALLKDKDGYRWLDKEEQLKRGAAMHACYSDFLARIRPDFMLFPDLETVDGFVAMNLCAELNLGVLYYTETRAVGLSYLASDPYETLPVYFGAYTDDDLRAARAAIEKFDQRRSNDAGRDYPPNPPPKPSWFRRLIVSGYIRWRHERLHATEYDYGESIKHNLIPVTRWARRQRFDQLLAKYFDVSLVGNSPLPEKFVFYALHYTPESSINGLAPYYVDQFRVIDALLLSLPPGHRLVVKEHPAMYGMRPRSFYRELRRRPGVVMVHPALDTRALITKAAAVATVTGTIGLESYLLDTPCILFGRNFFSHLCYGAPALPELRDFLRELIASYRPPSVAEKEVEFAKLINIGGDFVIGDPWFIPTVMAPENIRAARDYFWRHLARIGAMAKT